MKEWFYKTLVYGSEKFGQWFFRFFAWFVATGYFVFFPCRVKTGINFYRMLFPNRGLPWHIVCTWRQFHNFTDVFLERAMMVNLSGDASFSSRGLEHLKRAVMNHTGGIILMSHAGSWEMAAHHLKRELPEISLMLYMGAKHNERIEKLQKNDLKKTGIRVVAVDRDCGSPFDIVEGVKHLREGGMVSMTGDVLWRNDQRCVPVAFLGCEALLPETPYLLALLAHVPLYVFFAWRNGRKQYHVSISAPIVILKTSRDHRRNAVQKAAQQYADLLAQNIRRHPCQWYHFDPFLGKKII